MWITIAQYVGGYALAGYITGCYLAAKEDKRVDRWGFLAVMAVWPVLTLFIIWDIIYSIGYGIYSFFEAYVKRFFKASYQFAVDAFFFIPDTLANRNIKRNAMNENKVE